MIDSLQTHQNPDGGWPYRSGGTSWTEPTVFALLAGYATGDSNGRSHGLDWVRSMQRADGGWSPKTGVEQSTWVTALVALLPAADLGDKAHQGAIHWLLGLSAANATMIFRLRSWMKGDSTAEPNQGWPWIPGTAAWATPTAMAILALAKQNRRAPDSELESRIASARRFLLAHRCPDGGWNHGSAKALGTDAVSYPETTGTALLALAAQDRGTVQSGLARDVAPSIQRAEAWWNDCPSCEAASWLMLGLRAAGHAKSSAPANLKPRTLQDAALALIAAAGDRGTEVFLA